MITLGKPAVKAPAPGAPAAPPAVQPPKPPPVAVPVQQVQQPTPPKQAPIPAPSRPVAPPAQAVIPAQPAAPRSLTQARASAPALPTFAEAVPEGEIAPGFEYVGNEAYQMPMLSIAQAMSPQVQEHHAMDAGDVYLTTDRAAAFFPAGVPAPVIPFYYYKSWDRWHHRDLGGGLIDSSVDPGSPNAQMAARQLRERRGKTKPTAQEQPVQAVESLVFLVLFKDVNETTGAATYIPVAIPFTKSKYKKGRMWLQLSQTGTQGGKYPIYSIAYTIRSVIEKGTQGTYYNFDVDFAPEGTLTAEDYDAAKQAFVEFDPIFKQRKLQLAEDDPAAVRAADAEVIGPVPGTEADKAAAY